MNAKDLNSFWQLQKRYFSRTLLGKLLSGLHLHKAENSLFVSVLLRNAAEEF